MAKKNVIIITSRVETTVSWEERRAYVEEFCQQIESLQADLAVTYTTYQDLQFQVTGNKLSILDSRNQQDLKEFDFVHFKNWTSNAQEASVIANYLEWNGVSYLNSEVKTGLANNKIAQMFLLAHAQIPVPTTFFRYKQLLIELFKNDRLPDGFNFPLIIKANDGSKGDFNYLVHNKDEAIKALTGIEAKAKEFVVQNFIQNDGDYRILFIGVENPPFIFMRRGANNSHLNNTSKGGSANFVNPESLSPQILDLAKKSARLFGREIGGVDILIDSQTQKPYVLEVNGTPALATGYGVKEKTSKFADYLTQQLEAQEEE